MLGIFIKEINYKHVKYIYTHGCFTKQSISLMVLNSWIKLSCKWSDTNRPYFLCIFCNLHWTTNIVSIYYQSSSRMIHTDVVLQDDSHRRRPPGWFTQTHKMFSPYMCKMIREWPCEVVLKRMTQSWDSYIVIKGMLGRVI
jgi:hypothetical protein